MEICVITGTRAEYGLLRPFMREVVFDPELELQLLVTGMHLAPEFGETWQIIEEDGFQIDAKVEMLLASDSATGAGKSTGLALMGCVTELARLKPDWVVVLGDRYEIFAAATACTFLKIPVAHFHGGETTEGAFDECFRHSITKMSHLHFTASEEYRKRVIQLGEQPERVFAFGAPGLDAIAEMELMSRDDFEKSIDFKLAEKNVLVTYHPETLSDENPVKQFEEILFALDLFPELGIIFTYPNSDTGGRALIKRLEEYVRVNHQRACAHVSLGQLRYYSALKYVDLVLGNSSSGLIEVPAFKIPTVNIGGRQAGRAKGNSVIDCEAEKSSIEKAIQEALRLSLDEIHNPYGKPGASAQALTTLKSVSRKSILKKKFYDLK